MDGLNVPQQVEPPRAARRRLCPAPPPRCYQLLRRAPHARRHRRQAIDVARHVHTRQACIRAETGVLPLSTHRHHRGKQVRSLHLATHTALQNVADDAIADAVMAISMRAARQTGKPKLPAVRIAASLPL